MGLEDGHLDRQKSILWHGHPHFVSHFAMDHENEFQPRATSFDENRYEVHIEHFQTGKD